MRSGEARRTLRRTFASILAEINLPPRRAMYLIGHTDPTLTMRVYQQVIRPIGRGAQAAACASAEGLRRLTIAGAS